MLASMGSLSGMSEWVGSWLLRRFTNSSCIATQLHRRGKGEGGGHEGGQGAAARRSPPSTRQQSSTQPPNAAFKSNQAALPRAAPPPPLLLQALHPALARDANTQSGRHPFPSPSTLHWTHKRPTKGMRTTPLLATEAPPSTTMEVTASTYESWLKTRMERTYKMGGVQGVG